MSISLQSRAHFPFLGEIMERFRSALGLKKASANIVFKTKEQETEEEAKALFAAYEANKHKFSPILSAYGEDEPDYTDSVT